MTAAANISAFYDGALLSAAGAALCLILAQPYHSPRLPGAYANPLWRRRPSAALPAARRADMMAWRDGVAGAPFASGMTALVGVGSVATRQPCRHLARGRRRRITSIYFLLNFAAFVTCVSRAVLRARRGVRACMTMAVRSALSSLYIAILCVISLLLLRIYIT